MSRPTRFPLVVVVAVVAFGMATGSSYAATTGSASARHARHHQSKDQAAEPHAGKPFVTYSHVSKKKCTISRGQEKSQDFELCQAGFTVTVTGLRKGERVEVAAYSRDEGDITQATFTARSASLTHRFPKQVIFAGKPHHLAAVPYQVIVYRAHDQVVRKSALHRF